MRDPISHNLCLMAVLFGAFVAGCSSDAGNGPQSEAAGGLPPYEYGGSPASSGTGGLGVGGALAGTGAGMALGGAGASGESGTGGGWATGGTTTGGVAAGGEGGTGGVPPASGGGSGGGAVDFWGGATWAPAGVSNPAQHDNTLGSNCGSCHEATLTTSGPAGLLFGGTVYGADGTTGAADVEVGVSDGTNAVYTHTAANGIFWVLADGTTRIDWSSATVRIRNGNGERIKPAGQAADAGCNASSCHGSGHRLIAP